MQILLLSSIALSLLFFSINTLLLCYSSSHYSVAFFYGFKNWQAKIDRTFFITPILLFSFSILLLFILEKNIKEINSKDLIALNILIILVAMTAYRLFWSRREVILNRMKFIMTNHVKTTFQNNSISNFQNLDRTNSDSTYIINKKFKSKTIQEFDSTLVNTTKFRMVEELSLLLNQTNNDLSEKILDKLKQSKYIDDNYIWIGGGHNINLGYQFAVLAIILMNLKVRGVCTRKIEYYRFLNTMLDSKNSVPSSTFYDNIQSFNNKLLDDKVSKSIMLFYDDLKFIIAPLC